ncbi:MAG: hypothetical protein JNN30_13850 [Rhodanobacteraceae bacterium]|nr:hypothetical protein [Rhodanobacteraceae bacterium]
MIQALFVLILASGATDCRMAAQSVHLESFGELAKSLANLPIPRRLPPAGGGIISFEIAEDGRARAINVECRSSELTGNFLKGLISATRFQAPAKVQRGIRQRVGLNVDIAEGDNVKVSVTDFPRRSNNDSG